VRVEALLGELFGVSELFDVTELVAAAVELVFGPVELFEGFFPGIVERCRTKRPRFRPTLITIFPGRTSVRVACKSRSARRFSRSSRTTFFSSSSIRFFQPTPSLVPSEGLPGVRARTIAVSALDSSS